MTNALDTYVAALQSLTADRLEDFMLLVADDVHFRDPFNDCRGRGRYRAVLKDMFENLDSIEFSVDQCASAAARAADDTPTALIKWTLTAKLHKKPWRLEGCSELRFGSNGLVVAHHDYWDAAAGLYERFPLIGRVLKLLRRRIRVDRRTRVNTTEQTYRATFQRNG
ncbi:MAG: steroid delta-isomerase [Gammaproteobacteria bacterium]|jgi:steroid delta-isomerase